MKLLVAGDSFAEFSGFRNHLTLIADTNKQSIGDSSKPYSDDEFDHWCELLVKKYKGVAVSHGLGAHDVSSTSYVAHQQVLFDKSYTHVIFFVSEFLREMNNKNIDDLETWSKEAVRIKEFETLIDFYKNHKIYSNHDFSGSRHKSQMLSFLKNMHKPVIYEASNGGANLLEYVSNQRENLDDELRAKIHYITHFPIFRYMHDRISNIALLKEVCHSKNIPIIFVDCFGQHLDTLKDIGVDIVSFNLQKVTEEMDIDFFDDEKRTHYPSHFYKDEHQLILKYFLEKFPDWGK